MAKILPSLLLLALAQAGAGSGALSRTGWCQNQGSAIIGAVELANSWAVLPVPGAGGYSKLLSTRPMSSGFILSL